MDYEFYLIGVRDQTDIGKNEKRRFKITKMEPLEGFELNMGEAGCKVYGTYVHPATPSKETDSAPTNKSLEERVKSLETTIHNLPYYIAQTNMHEQQLKELIESQSKLRKRLCSLSDAFEAECDHYDEEIDTLTKTADIWTAEGNRILTNCQKEVKCLKQQLSELQQAFVKYAICKPTELPQGGKGYIAAEPIERGKFVHIDSCGKVRECSKENTTPRGSTEQADGILKWIIPADKTNVEGTVIFDPKNPTELMTIEEAERQIKALDQNIKTRSESEYSFIYTAVIKNLENEKRELEQWIENQKSIPPEPDIVEQIKAGENRLWELRKSADCVAAIANSASETVSLKEHVIKLMSIHTGLNITGIRMCNKTYKIHYNCKEKGIYVELD